MIFYPARDKDKLIGIMAEEIGVDFFTLRTEIKRIEEKIERQQRERKQKKQKGERNERKQ
ncbi:MAG: hypothetical protein J7L63_05015 [Thermoplasmata archaeon]|nr:hypothetical protein [Thermoplasmata archaeon]